MSKSAFVEIEFFALTFSSLFFPISVYGYMMWKKAISRKTVLLFGVLLLVVSGVSIFLLRRLAEIATASPSLLDDRVFISEFSIVLYILPILFAGIGVNLISHVLIAHLTEAERRFEQDRK